MRPVLFAFHLPIVGEVTIPAYFTLLGLGFAVALWMTWRDARRLRLDPDLIIDMNLWMILCGMLGARVLHVIADGHLQEYVDLCLNPKAVPVIDAAVSSCTADAQCGFDYLCDTARNLCHPPRDCLAALKFWQGGLAYYGGFLCAVAYGLHFVRKHRLPVGRVADLAAPAIALGLFFGRLGCFLNGCCFGKPTSSFPGVVFPRGSDAWRAHVDAHLISAAQPPLAVHPTQLYESLACLAIAAVLYLVVRPRKRRNGDVWAGLLILYALARSLIEVFRDDERGVFFGGYLSTSQLISLPLLLAGVVVPWWTRRPARAALVSAPPPPAGPVAG